MTAPKLGIVYAMPIEGVGLASALPRHHEPVRVRDDCAIICSGIGGENARRAATALCETGVEALVSWGFAAGLVPSLKAGAIVVPETVVDSGGQRVAVDGQLHRLFYQRLSEHLLEHGSERITVQTGDALTWDEPIGSSQHKAALSRRFDVATVDMESAVVARVAQSRGLPFVALRVVLDTSDQSLPQAVLDGMSSDGSFAVARACAIMLRHPVQLLGMAWLALNTWRARMSLQQAARCLAAPAAP